MNLKGTTMQFIKLILLSFLLSSVSCSQFLSQRSYLSQMEHDDSTFFNPRTDFPVVVGDTGRDWETKTERLSRTPDTESEVQDDQGRRFLKQELKALEGRQADEDLAFYETHKIKLASTSEKIYFLKLPHAERAEYLYSRGVEDSTRAPASESAYVKDDAYGVRDSNLSSGMTKADVMNSWGKPNRVEIAGNPSYENERWLYKLGGASKYIYFESGLVDGWE